MSNNQKKSLLWHVVSFFQRQRCLSKRFCWCCWLCYAYLCLLPIASAQTNDSLQHIGIPFLQKAEQIHRGRTCLISIGSSVVYGTSMTAIGKIWYSQYEQSRFHFFNDNSGWLQIDKVGHAWTAYNQAYLGANLYEWAGHSPQKAAWIGFGIANVFQGGIEVLDGFSVGWGASWGDIGSNFLGASLHLSQALLWKEQRILFKYSTHHPKYGGYPLQVQARAEALYGGNFAQKWLKDYNAQSYWLSANPSAFMGKNKIFPAWLNIAVGYSAEDMFGAESNVWKNPNNPDMTYDFSAIQRYRQYYLSFDVDFSRIKTRSRWVKTMLKGINFIKFPAPALEWNTKNGFRFHPIYW